MLSDWRMLSTTSDYDEALERFHRTGPEREGWLSNHGPMVIEALERLGRDDQVHRFSDRYLPRLEEVPRGIQPIDAQGWRDAIGDPVRTGDWINFFLTEVEKQPWQAMLTQWWPRLLPGIAAGATHGVIRTGHAVRALRALETRPRRRELAHALAYWAARWQPVPVVPASGSLPVDAVITGIPPVPHQEFGIRNRLSQLTHTPGWKHSVSSLVGPNSSGEVPAALEDVIDGVLAVYSTRAHGEPTMLVHAATAPMAVVNTLPSLPQTMWIPSFDAAWSASAAVLAAYLPPDTRPPRGTEGVEDLVEEALNHGGEHVIKLTDTALYAHQRSGNESALSAVRAAIDLDA